MSTAVTILIVPRDRFSSVVPCAESVVQNTREPYDLVFLDFGYDKATRDRLQAVCSGVPTQFVDCGRAIPMAALRSFVPRLTTRYLAWLDNDTFVTPGWLGALLDRAAAGAQVILPVTLEREGLDVDPRRIPLRNHISHSELREVTVRGRKYVFDHKPYRRAAPEELPKEAHTVDFFELHAFFIETAVLARLDIPDMVVREHIDLGIQLHRLGIPIWCEPRSSVIFDNIHTRPTLGDIRFFQYRWAEPLIDRSHDLFEKRWGYRFYNEQFMKNWAFRRKVFSWARFAGLPHGAADLASRAVGRFLRAPIPAELRPDPLPESVRVLARST
jgi:Glycosyl transferase family 2